MLHRGHCSTRAIADRRLPYIQRDPDRGQQSVTSRAAMPEHGRLNEAQDLILNCQSPVDFGKAHHAILNTFLLVSLYSQEER